MRWQAGDDVQGFLTVYDRAVSGDKIRNVVRAWIPFDYFETMRRITT